MIIETGTLISIGAWIGKKIADKGFDEGFKQLVSSKKINDKFYESVDSVSTNLQAKYPDLLGGSIDYFFKEESVITELTKLLFTSSRVDLGVIAKNFDTKQLPDDFILEFITDLKAELLKDQDFDKIFSDKELFVTLQGIGSDLDVIAENSIIAKRDIEKIALVIEDRMGKIFSYEEFHKDYSQKAYNTLSNVNFLGLGVDSSIPRNTKKLKDVFVKPNFTPIDRKHLTRNTQKLNIPQYRYEDEHSPIVYRDLVSYHQRLVILGNPGSGKSVLVKAVMCSILKKELSEFKEEEIASLLPFRIELRKYLSYKKESRGNILNYLTVLLEEEYGIYNTTNQILDSIFNEHNCIIFFDGLDEIFRVKDKIEVKNDIENFHTSYKNLRSLTTSRIIGYVEASFQVDQYCELTIQNFNDGQVEEYVRKWYEKEEENEEI